MELTARLDAQNVAGRNLESQLGEEQRQRAAATEELARATSSLAEANRNLREERERAAAALSPGEQKLLQKRELKQGKGSFLNLKFGGIYVNYYDERIFNNC